MKVPDYDREDPGELEEVNRFLAAVAEKTGVQANPTLQPLLERITRQVEFLTQAVTRRLTLQDNHNADVRTITFEQLVPKKIRANVTGAVKEVRIRQTFPKGPFLSPRMLDWATLGSGEIEVVVKWDTAPPGPVDVEIVIEGD